MKRTTHQLSADPHLLTLLGDELIGAIARCPYKIDTVSFVLESRHGIWTAQLPIKPKGPSKKKRTFGEVTLQFVDGAQGRFAGLLPAADDDPGGGSPLH